jgi:two-component system cell cycle response regulator
MGPAMKDRRALLAVIIGIGALVVGIVTAAAAVAWLGAVAGVLGLFAGAISLAIARERDRIAAGSTALEEEITKLEGAVAAQVQARLTAEEAVQSLGQQLSAAERRSAPPKPRIADNTGDEADVLHDEDTGLFSERYFRVAVDARIASARRHLRPVAIALLDIVVDARSDDPQPAPAGPTAEAIEATLREADTACRLEDGRFALVLEDTPESGAIWTVERIRRAIAKTRPDVTMWAGIACYPAHAFDAAAVIERANRALVSARDWHQDRIEVATVD